PRPLLVGVEHLVERRPHAAEQAGREPHEQRQAERGQPAAVAHDAAQRALDGLERPVRASARSGGEEARQQLVQTDLRGSALAPRRLRFASVRRRSSASRAVGEGASASSSVSSSCPSSSTFSLARSRRPRSLPASLPRVASPSGANRKPTTAPIPRPSRKEPNPAPRSLTLPPPDRPGRRPRRRAAGRGSAAAAARSGRRWRAYG